MSIKLKVSLILAALFAGLLGLDAVVLFWTVMPSFDNLERREVKDKIYSSVNAIKSEINSLDTLNHDWAAWDDTYNFVIDRNSAYIKSGLIPETFVSDHINLLFIYDRDGNTVWGRSYDLATKKFINIEEFPQKGLGADSPLLAHKNPASVITGLFDTELGPMLISSRPIITSKEVGPIRGTMIMGRLLDRALLDLLSRRAHTKLDIRSPPEKGKAKGDYRVVTANTGNLDVFAPLTGIDRTTIAWLHARVPRDITIEGEASVEYALALMVITSLAILLAVLLLLQKMIISPLSTMTKHVVRIGIKGTLLDPLLIEGNDEIGFIARAFNRMQERLSLLAHYDSLTGLTNRQLFVDRASQLLKLARRDKTHVAVLFLDLDNFKNVNDTLGHHVGDNLLKSVAAILTAELRECDIISRMGGDEFTIVAHGISGKDEFIVIGNKIVNLFKAPLDADGVLIEITTSVGISIFPDHGDDVETLLKNADIALYQAKGKGRNNFQIFTPS